MSSSNTTTNAAATPSPFKGYQFNIYQWCLFASGTILIFIRFYVQFRLRARLGRELFVLGAWLLFLATTIEMSLDTHYHEFETAYNDFTPDNAAVIAQLKLGFAHLLTFKTCIYMCKFSLLCFYMDLVPRRPGGWRCNKLWLSIVVTWATNIVGAGFQLIMPWFICPKVSDNWDVTKYQCSWSVYWPFVFSWSWFMFTDLQVYIIPFIILPSRLQHLPFRQKRAAYWMFAAGFVNVGSAAFMVAMYILPNALMTTSMSVVLEAAWDFCTAFQQWTAIIIVCLPQVRRLWLGLDEETMRRQMEEKTMEAEAEWTRRGSAGSAGSASANGSQTTVVAGGGEGDIEAGLGRKESQSTTVITITKEVSVSGDEAV